MARTREALIPAEPAKGPARRDTRALRERARRRILEAAIREFSERGYARVSTRDIARRAGVAVGLPYRYFQSKDELFAACIDLGSGIWRERLARHMAEHPPRTLAEHVVEHLVCVRSFLSEDDLGLWRAYMRHIACDDVPFLARLEEAGNTTPLFDHALQSAVARGEIREDVPWDLAQYVVDMVFTDVQETLYHRYGSRDFGLCAAASEAEARALLTRIVDTALAGILRAPDARGRDAPG